MHTLFVYGTLMRGERAGHYMAAAEWLGPARTEARFTLHMVQWYPGMASGGRTAVIGEVYRVPPDLMAELDAYEGPEYTRMSVPLAEGPVASAEAYVMSPQAAELLAVIPSGDWRVR